jgi:hypothetical protein
VRHKGSISEVQVERNRLLLKMFNDIKKECRHASAYDICQEISLMPAPRYYMSEERGYVVYLQWIMYGDIEVVSPHKKLLYLDFVRRCDEHPRNGLGMKDIVFEVLQQPAIILGVSTKHIMKIIHNSKLSTHNS